MCVCVGTLDAGCVITPGGWWLHVEHLWFQLLVSWLVVTDTLILFVWQCRDIVSVFFLSIIKLIQSASDELLCWCVGFVVVCFGFKNESWHSFRCLCDSYSERLTGNHQLVQFSECKQHLWLQEHVGLTPSLPLLSFVMSWWKNVWENCRKHSSCVTNLTENLKRPLVKSSTL